MTVTIKDIARKVGVNPSTVSRVVNGTASISEETRKKILAAMEELDYHPNSLARSLVNGSTSTIGLIIDAGNSDAFSNAFFIRSVSAIETVAQQRGFHLLLAGDTDRGMAYAVKNLVQEHKVDGVILPVSIVTEELLALLLKQQFPFVVMGEPAQEEKGVYWVDMDNEHGSRQAVEHLMRAGYRHPVLLVENRGTVFEKKRIEGFRREKKDLGIAWSQDDVIECGTKPEEIGVVVRRLLQNEMDVDSLICPNNIVAYHVLTELKRQKKSVPCDIGVVTFDNYPLAEYMDPPLTVVDVDTYQLGEAAANALFDRIKERPGEGGNRLLPTRIIGRASTIGGEGEIV